jgi:prevent-host-death family protein
MQVTQVGIRELKAKLSAYMEKVKSGQTIVVTEHGKPIGQLVPIKPTLQERLESLEQAGFLAQAGQKIPAQKPSVINQSNHLISDLVIEDRDGTDLP